MTDKADVITMAVCRSCVGSREFWNKTFRNRNAECSCSFCHTIEKCADADLLVEIANETLDRYFLRGISATSFELDRLIEAGILNPTGDCLHDLITHGFEISNDSLVEYLIQRLMYLDDEIDIKMSDYFDENEYLYGQYRQFVEFDWGAYELWKKWERAGESIKKGGRFFAQEASEIFDELLSEFDKALRDQKIEHFIGFNGTEDDPVLWRARAFPSQSALSEALIDPVKSIGPPPSRLATLGRMNPSHVQVFYAAETPELAISEIRAPVGSWVAVAPFKPLRRMQLFDVSLAIRKDDWKAGYFNTRRKLRNSRSRFFSMLNEDFSRPVLPGQESAEYLRTQAFCEFLQRFSHKKYDGLVYSSAQNPDGGKNIVLFDHIASSVEPSGERIRDGCDVSATEGMKRVHFDVHIQTPSGNEADGSQIGEDNDDQFLKSRHSLRLIEKDIQIHRVRSQSLVTTLNSLSLRFDREAADSYEKVKHSFLGEPLPAYFIKRT